MAAFQLRRAQPGQIFTYTSAEGKQVNLRADDDGVVEPSNVQEVALLDSFDLPVARKAEAAKAEPKGGND